MTHKQRLVVIGGGAAGFFCAINAATFHPNLEIVILEKSAKLLSKVAISGGGRCNITQACPSISEMIKAYPRGAKFLKKAFHQFFTHDTLQWFAGKDVPTVSEADGRIFPLSNTSQTVVDCLLNEARKSGIQIRVKSGVNYLEKSSNHYLLKLNSGEELKSDFVCIACGGLPKRSQYEWLSSLDLKISEPVPSLFTFNLPKNPITQLMGISFPEAKVKIKGTKLKSSGPLLITHWGFSGPTILRLSAFGARYLADNNYFFEIQINWLPEYNEEKLRDFFQDQRKENGKGKLHSRNPFGLPSRFWLFLLQKADIDKHCNYADLDSKKQNLLIKLLCNDEYTVSGKTTFKDEFVTCGGVALEEIDVNSMMSKKHPGLFFAGEIMDIDGITGGFNFQNAWTTGYIAAKNIMPK